MRWQLEWGGQAKFLEELARTQGRRIKALDTRPQVPIYLQDAWDAFFTLSRSRPMGFSGPGPIPFSEIKAYIELFQLDCYDPEDFIALVSELDREFLAFERPGKGKKSEAKP